MQQNVTFIESLTPLRGIAALWVVAFHFDTHLNLLELDYLFDREQTMLVGNGYLFVDFFFVLSGFIITHVYGEKLAKGGKSIIKKYLTARFSRLYPLHLFLMLLMGVPSLLGALLVPEIREQMGWESLYTYFVHLFFGQSSGLLSGYSWNVPSWSIAAEWWTYILAIVIIPLINVGFGWRTMLAWILSICGLVALITYGGLNSLDHTYDWGTVRCILEFTFGIGLYQVFKSKAASWFRHDLVFVAAVVLMIALLHFNIYDALLIPAFALVIISAATNQGIVSKVLNTRPLKYVGDVSYSVYMMQMFILGPFMGFGQLWKTQNPGIDPPLYLKLSFLFLAMGILLGLSWLTYKYIEVAWQKKIRKWAD